MKKAKLVIKLPSLIALSWLSGMSSIHRNFLLTAYRWATWPQRRRIAQTFEVRSSYPAAVLFYHRVANSHPNSWTISTSNFERHLNWLQQNTDFVTLDQVRNSQESGTRSRACVAITFDDGYGENCQTAIPMLLERGIPVTYFVTTHPVETNTPFRHDVARGVPLPVNTIAEIRNMANHGVKIGAHSSTHADLGATLSKAQLKTEIVDVRKKLQDWTGQSVDYFAFPYGLPQNISQAAVDMIFEAGYLSFVSACGGWNQPGQDFRHIQRIHGDPGMGALLNWLTYDPRKIHRRTRVRYHVNQLNESNAARTVAPPNSVQSTSVELANSL